MNINKIRELVPEAALYEQLAEEAAELAHAALKYARILRGENPTPCKVDDTKRKVVEELGDVEIAAYVANIDFIEDEFVEIKLQRWVDRLEATKHEQID